jgi:hypothetical protein
MIAQQKNNSRLIGVLMLAAGDNNSELDISSTTQIAAYGQLNRA